MLTAAVCGIVLSLFLTGLPARAQRTMKGQFFLTGSFMKNFYPAAGTDVLGGEVYFRQYLGSFYWHAGLQYTPSYEKVPMGCVNLAGGAMYRLLETRSRMFNLYVGGDALFGCDYPGGRNVVADIVVDDKTGAIKTDDVPDDSGKTAIVYGVEPRIELEFFLLKQVALVAGASAPVKIRTQQDVLSGRYFAGLRVNF
jgi:hypothetical protein